MTEVGSEDGEKKEVCGKMTWSAAIGRWARQK